MLDTQHTFAELSEMAASRVRSVSPLPCAPGRYAANIYRIRSRSGRARASNIKGLTPHPSRPNGTASVATIPWRFTYLCWNIPHMDDSTRQYLSQIGSKGGKARWAHYPPWLMQEKARELIRTFVGLEQEWSPPTLTRLEACIQKLDSWPKEPPAKPAWNTIGIAAAGALLLLTIGFLMGSNHAHLKILNKMSVETAVVVSALVYKLAALAAGSLMAYMGYKLFLTRYEWDTSETTFSWKALALSIKKTAPGTFFAVFGIAIILVTISTGLR